MDQELKVEDRSETPLKLAPKMSQAWRKSVSSVASAWTSSHEASHATMMYLPRLKREEYLEALYQISSWPTRRKNQRRMNLDQLCSSYPVLFASPLVRQSPGREKINYSRVPRGPAVVEVTKFDHRRSLRRWILQNVSARKGPHQAGDDR